MRKHHVHGIGVLRLSLVCAVLAIPAMVPPAYAQYFGRNKVEYTDFDFRILTTEHFDIYYYAREERAARIAAQLAERWYSRISTVLNHQLERRQPLVIYGSQAEFAQTNVVSGLVPDSVGGVTESLRRRIVMPFAPTMAETDRVLGHELVHAFQFDIARRYGGGIGQPLWFVEGMAEYLARGSADAESGLWLRDAVRTDRLPRKQGDAARKLSPYQYGHAFWSYLGNRFGDAGRREGAEAGQEAPAAQGSDALRDRRGSRHAARRLAAQRDSVCTAHRAAPIALSCGAGAACSSDRRSARTASTRCSSPSAIDCRWICSSPTSRADR